MTNAKAAELRESAAAHDREAEDSFQRCDTDGALTQWSHGVNAQKDRLQADIEENDGKAEFTALFDLEGNLVAAKYIETRFGWAWGVLENDDPNSAIVSWFNSSEARKGATARRNDARKGYCVGYVSAPAYAALRGGNMLTLTAVPVRRDGGFSRDVEILDNGHGKDGGGYYQDW